MPKKAKIGKNRKDKFYSIAKEVGYRARSAFKLVQLNKKFQFLQNSRVLIDLCAAPGGWLQVAKQHMPVESKIVGVDLVPIKAITGVKTIQADITTDSCKSKLREYLRDWKCDVVLNDGAPNVGKNWHLDAFSQSELTLKSCQLAAFFLRPGGWFITKVFRSNDYNALVWVMKQLFKKVHATKPAASRNESAEIFVVCQGYRAPSKIDPKFFDIKTALAQVESTQKEVQMKDFEGMKKRKAVGYEDGATMLYKEKKDTEFFEAEKPLEFIYQINKILISKEHADENPTLYNEDIIQFCEDTKVVDKRGVKKLLKWREKMRKVVGLESDNEESESEEEAADLDSDEEEMKQMETEALEHMKSQLKDMRSKKKKREKSLKGLRELISNTVKLDQVEDVELFNKGLFDLKSVKSNLKDDDFDKEVDKSDSEVELEEGDEEDLPEFLNVPEKQFDMDEETNELIVPLEEKTTVQDRRTQQWFGNSEWFDGLAEEGDKVDHQNIKLITKEKETSNKADKNKPKENSEKIDDQEMEVEVQSEVQAHLQEEAVSDSESESESDDSEDERQRLALRDMEERIGSIPIRRDDKLSKRKRLEEERKRKEFPLTPEQLAMATEMVTSKRKKRDLEELMYDKVAFNDPAGLPEWFTSDEKKHRFRRAPEVSKELVDMYRERQKAANVKTIKKVVEAKARKKRKMMKKAENARKAAEGVLNQEDVSSREKQAQVKRIYNKAGLGKKEKEHITYVPIKQGAGRRVARPAGVKGKFKVVDSRMKCEMRSEKARERRQGKRPSGGRGLNSQKRRSQRSK